MRFSEGRCWRVVRRVACPASFPMPELYSLERVMSTNLVLIMTLDRPPLPTFFDPDSFSTPPPSGPHTGGTDLGVQSRCNRFDVQPTLVQRIQWFASFSSRNAIYLACSVSFDERDKGCRSDSRCEVTEFGHGETVLAKTGAGPLLVNTAQQTSSSRCLRRLFLLNCPRFPA